jgi:hypothetical protein
MKTKHYADYKGFLEDRAEGLMVQVRHGKTLDPDFQDPLMVH